LKTLIYQKQPAKFGELSISHRAWHLVMIDAILGEKATEM
jgi:hypothetical protein